MPSGALFGLTMGTAGAMLLGYCIYYDQKRRSDAAYKRKLHQRRQPEALQVESDQHQQQLIEDHLDLELRFENEMKMGEHLICQGNIADGVSHFANAIMMCAQPLPVLQTIQESLPDFVFMPLLIKLTELQSNGSLAKAASSTTSITDIP